MKEKFLIFWYEKKYFQIKFQKSGKPIFRWYACEDLCPFLAYFKKI